MSIKAERSGPTLKTPHPGKAFPAGHAAGTGQSRPLPGVLLLHGFGGGPWEVAPLADYLRHQGFKVSTPRIPGLSGDQRREMRRADTGDWISAAARAYEDLRRQSDRVILAGFSTGGLIAVHLALKHPPEAVVFISTPVRHWDLKRILLNLRQDLAERQPEHLKFYLKSAVKFPLKALLAFKHLQRQTKPLFGQLSCPVLILQGKDDDTVHWKSAAFICRRLRSAGHSPSLHYYEPAGHVMLLGPAAQMAKERVLKFIQDSCIL